MRLLTGAIRLLYIDRLTMDCHDFTGWNTRADGSGMQYRANDTVYMDSADIALYLQWEAKKYLLRYDENGLTGGRVPDSVDCKAESSVKVGSMASMMRDGYRADGWYRAKNGYGKRYPAGEMVTDKDTVYVDTQNVTLYAFWTPSNMVRIFAAGKTFLMGDANGNFDDKPVHEVSFIHDFWMDTVEVTQGDYHYFMSVTYAGYATPAWNSTIGSGAGYPAYFINFYDTALYCNALSIYYGLENDSVYKYSSISGTPGKGCILHDLTADNFKKGYCLPWRD